MAAPASDFDLIVIGGGINGAAIARDAALRGLSVLLLEKSDFGSGTSSFSSRLIHGGLRYLEYAEFPLVFESLRERRLLLELAPHLVRKLQITVPVYKRSKRGLWLVRLGMFIYGLLSIGKVVPGHRILTSATMAEQLPGLESTDLLGGAQYYDAQATFPERLVIENVVGAAAAGAVVKNYSPVVRLNVKKKRLHSVEYQDRESGEILEVRATVVVNASGPWVDRVLASSRGKLPRFMGGTKGSHIVVPIFAGAPQSAVYAEAGVDSRPFFIIPWNQQFLIGTTDIRYSGDPEDAGASDAEIDYLLSETNQLFPRAGLQRKDIHYSYAGVRPLPKRESGPESAITRKHIIKKHRLTARGLVSIIGGKLTTYRSLAEQTANYVNKKTGLKGSPCKTRTQPLPGALNIDEARSSLNENSELSVAGRERLLSIYGGRVTEILELAISGNEFAGFLDPAKTILVAEVGYVIRYEFAVSLIDIIFRRMMLGLTADQGAHFSQRVAEVASTVLGWSGQERERQVQILHDYNRKLKGVR